jgi:hypothetical protein
MNNDQYASIFHHPNKMNSIHTIEMKIMCSSIIRITDEIVVSAAFDFNNVIISLKKVSPKQWPFIEDLTGIQIYNNKSKYITINH